MKYNTKQISALLTLGLVMIFSYQNCSDNGYTAASTVGPIGDTVNRLNVASNRLVSTVYSENILENMVALSGAKLTANNATQVASLNFFYGNAYVANNGAATAAGAKARINETGAANGVTPTMFMTITNTAGEVCDNVYKAEKAMAAASRRFYNKFNFAAAPNQQSAAVDDAAARMARSFWGRDITTQEAAVVALTMAQTFGSSTTVADTDKEALALCTAILSSIDAHIL